MDCWVKPCVTLNNAQALVDMVGDTVQEMEELSVGATPGNAQGLVYAGADKVAELEAVTPGDTLGDAHVLNDLVGDTWRHTGQCASSGRHAG